jgi:hypothetical protein
MGLYLNHIKLVVHRLPGMQIVPTPDLNAAPIWMLKGYEFIRFAPGLGLFEGETRTMLSRSASLSWHLFLNGTKEHPVFPEPGDHATGLILECVQEVVIAVFGIPGDDI